ncbi:MAG: efflux RND transporter periplasmic adaptor subunit [Rhodocyclales bacterium]|nr:efflux RND transporter periplasmic adaptor subunit [Rhodocyclales bacterium]
MQKTFAAGLALLLLAACGQKAEERKAGPPPALITVTQVGSGEFEVVEETLGTLEVLADPKLGAEVPGRVVQVLARTGQRVKKGQVLALIDAGDTTLANRADEAEVRRLEALAAQQDRLLERQQSLVAKGFLSKNAGDDVAAQRTAVNEQLAAARARAENSRRSVGKTRVTAPLDAVVEVQIVAPGDYVKVGDPLFQLVAPHKLRAHLPFPEVAATRLVPGQTVSMTSPLAPGKLFESRIHEIRPGVVEGSRTLDVLADIDNREGLLRGGGTVNASVRIAAKATALTVPEQSVVLRPAGKVVYVIAEVEGQKRAQQKVVTAGAKRGGRVEILEGLAGGETVALDGAGFLTNNAVVGIKEPAKPGGKPGDKARVGAHATAKKADTPLQPAAK